MFSDKTTGGQIAFANSGSGGAITFSGANTYTGATTIKIGATLKLSGSGSIASSSGLADNGTFDISGVTSGTTVKDLTGAGTVTLGGKTLTLSNGATAKTFSGAFGNGGSGGVTVSAGSETLSGSVNYSGTTNVSSGATLKLTGSATLGGPLAVDGTFNYSGLSSDLSVSSLSGASTGVVTQGGNALTLTNAAGTFAGAIGGTGALNVNGGTETLSGANGYTGTTGVGSGATLKLSGAGTIGTGNFTNNGSFDISGASGSVTVKNLAGTNSAASVTLGANKLVDSTTKNAEFAGGISGTTGGLEVSGGNALTVDGAVNYSGATTIDSGSKLVLQGTVNLGDVQVNSGDGTTGLNLSSASGSTVTLTSIEGNGGVTVGGKAVVLTAANGTFNGNLAVNNSSSGSLEIKGGSETLTNYNFFKGGTTLDTNVANPVTLTLSLSGFLNSGVVVNAGAVFNNYGMVNNSLSGTYNGANQPLPTLNNTPTQVTGLDNHGTTTNSGSIWGNVINRALAMLSGSGSVHGNLSNDGTLSPNDPMAVSGNFTQNSDGTLAIDIGGLLPADIGGLAIGGSAVLAGDLDLTFTGGFRPAKGNSFEILTFGSHSGDFSAFADGTSACVALGGDAWSCHSTDGTITVFDEVFTGSSLSIVVAAVPEPASLVLLGGGLAGLGLLRRRGARRAA